MAKGRKPKAEGKVISGRFRSSSGGVAAPSADRPVAPEFLSKREAAHFDQIVARLEEQGRASASHTGVIALAAQRHVEIENLSEVIRKFGEVYVKGGASDDYDEDELGDEDFFIKPNPAVKARSDAMRHLHSLYAELALTPASSSKAAGAEKPKAQNRFRGAGLGR